MVKYIVTIIIIMTRKGKYMVREDIEKAPTHDHPCNLTRCVYSSGGIRALAIFCSKVFTSDHPLLQFSFWICVFLPLSIVKHQCSISSQEQKENIPYLGHYFWNEFRENWLEPVTFRCEIICKEHKITEHHSSAVFAK